MTKSTISLILSLLVLLSACSTVSDDRPKPVRKSEYYLEHGVSAFSNSDYLAATDFFNKALAHYRSIDDSNGVLLSLINLIETSQASGNFSAATKHIADAKSIVQRSAYSDYLPRLTLLEAQLQWRRRDSEKSLELLQTLLPEFDQEQRAVASPNLLQLSATSLRTAIAFSRIDQDETAAVLWMNRLSLMLPRTEGNTPLHRARLLRFKAQLSSHHKHYQQAFELLDEALEYYRSAAVRPAIAATLEESAEVLIKMERWQEAEEVLQRALYIHLWVMDRPSAKRVLKRLEHTYQQLGNDKKARQMRTQYESITQQ